MQGQLPPPDKFMGQLQCWLLRAFEARFSVDHKDLACALQNDTYSCGVVSANTIAHAALRDELWQPQTKSVARATWFILLARDWLNDVSIYFTVCLKSHTNMTCICEA